MDNGTPVPTREGGTLDGRTVVLGVSGSISAYKAADLCSKLIQAGARVYPILTTGALKFLQPAVFSGLSGMPTATGVFEEPFGAEQIAHLRYAEIADLFVVAPASADFLARLTAGTCDDMLSAALLANITKPVLLAPAMNSDMWANAATVENHATLERRGYRFIEPAVGRLAEGIIGAGRLAEPADIISEITRTLGRARDLLGVRVLVTAGPTREPIDPVRFLSNRSSGKMGYAIAAECAARGATVTLVTGPTKLPLPHGMAEVIHAETAADMEVAVLPRAEAMDVVVQAAAIADYRPGEPAPHKLKKSGDSLRLELLPTHDFSITLGERKHAKQILIGFAAETENLEVHARAKLLRKNLDLIVLNDVTRAGAGFDVDTNIVTLIPREGDLTTLPQMPKSAVARVLADWICARRTEPRLPR